MLLTLKGVYLLTMEAYAYVTHLKKTGQKIK